MVFFLGLLKRHSGRRLCVGTYPCLRTLEASLLSKLEDRRAGAECIQSDVVMCVEKNELLCKRLKTLGGW